MFYIGIDLGGTGIKAGVVNEEGKIVCKVSCPTGVERPEDYRILVFKIALRFPWGNY